MTKLEKIERDIASLSPADRPKLADWLAAYRESQNDRDAERQPDRRAVDKAEVERRLRLIEELAGAGARYGGLRSADEIDAMIREIRGDD